MTTRGPRPTSIGDEETTAADHSSDLEDKPVSQLLVEVRQCLNNLRDTHMEHRTAIDEKLQVVGKVQFHTEQLADRHSTAINKFIKERSDISSELAQLRQEFNGAVTEHQKIVTSVTRELEQSQHRANQRIEQLTRERDGAREDLLEALRSRDRLADRVATLEEKIEHTLVPLRKMVDDLRVKEAGAQEQLAAAKAQIGVEPSKPD